MIIYLIYRHCSSGSSCEAEGARSPVGKICIRFENLKMDILCGGPTHYHCALLTPDKRTGSILPTVAYPHAGVRLICALSNRLLAGACLPHEHETD